MRKRSQSVDNRQAGASIIEIVIALVILAILSAISLPYIFSYKKLYKSEDQALKVIDLMRETAQQAVTRRRTMRLEIDLTDNAVLIIDQNGGTTGTLVKKIPLELPRDVRIDTIPATVTKPNPPNYNDAAFATDAVGHLDGATTITAHNIWAARFKSDGSVVTAADVPMSANVYIFPPVSSGSTTARNKAEIRAITLFGGSGALRYWKHDGTNFVPDV
jgi:type II secretory pathway pseudopilin PulG